MTALIWRQDVTHDPILSFKCIFPFGPKELTVSKMTEKHNTGNGLHWFDILMFSFWSFLLFRISEGRLWSWLFNHKQWIFLFTDCPLSFFWPCHRILRLFILWCWSESILLYFLDVVFAAPDEQFLTNIYCQKNKKSYGLQSASLTLFTSLAHCILNDFVILWANILLSCLDILWI